jgi:hypothetical protein
MRRAGARRLAWLALACILGLSLGLKIGRYGDPRAADLHAEAEGRVRALLERAGFVALPPRPLNSGGSRRMLSFVKPGCAHPVRVVVLGPDGTDVGLITRGLPHADLVFLLDGEAFATAPLRRFQARRLRDAALRAVLGRGEGEPAPMPLLAVAPPPGPARCDPPKAAAWPR